MHLPKNKKIKNSEMALCPKKVPDLWSKTWFKKVKQVLAKMDYVIVNNMW